MTTTDSPWTEEHLAVAVAHWLQRAEAKVVASPEEHCRSFLDALAPGVAALQRAAYDRGYTDADNGKDPEYERGEWTP